MKKKLLVAILTVAFMATAARFASAYPIPPVTLWQLVAQADIVVLARVERIEIAERPVDGPMEGPWDRDIAVLRILETWKGDPRSEIRVSYCSTMMCPAPPRFEEGEVVLAFLETGETQMVRWREERAEMEAERLLRTPEDIAAEEEQMREYGIEPPTPEEKARQKAESEKSVRKYEEWAAGRWFAVALSYATLYPAEEDRPVFRDLVAQAVRLQATGKVDPADRREWLISAAERRATRWQGLYELAPKGDRLHYFYDSERREAKPDDEDSLTGEELARLAAGFVREPSVDSTLTMLLPLLAPLPDPELDRAAVAAIEAALEDRPRAWWLADAMALTLGRIGDADPEHRLSRENVDCNGRPICERVEAEALPRIWKEARRDLGIPEVARAEVPKRRVSGVGGETPD